MNKVTQEKISSAVITACENEGLMYKEAAKVFNTEPLYFTYLKNPKYWDTIPQKVWDKFHSWLYSGKKLKEYKMPGSYEEAQKLADASMGNAINEELAAILNNSGASIVEPAEEPIIKVKPEALKERNKKLKLKPIPVTEKPKRKYTRKPKENPLTEAERAVAETIEKIHVPVPEGTPLMAIPEQKVDAIGLLWLKMCPERQMIDAPSIQSIADECNVPFSFVKEVIKREIENDQRLINDNLMWSNPTTSIAEEVAEQEILQPDFEESASEVESLKSEIKTLAFLLQMEHEDNERLRAEVGYLNARIAYKVKQAEMVILRLRKDISKTSEECTNQRSYFYDAMLENKRKENEELEDAFRKLKNRTLLERILNKGVK